MHILLLSASLSLFTSTAIAGLDTSPTQQPLTLAQAVPPRLPPGGIDTPGGFRPPPPGDRPTHNGDRPTTGPRPDVHEPSSNRSPAEQRRLNPQNDPDVQRGIDENDRRMGR